MRVIAGNSRGRPLQAPRSAKVRPTADLVKGAIFSMLEAEAYKRGFSPTEELGFAAAGAWPRVLDLYAGSGALAIEALSRGARSADLVEPDTDARRIIAVNLARTALEDRARVHALTAERAVERLQGPFDLALLDPPYADLAIARLLHRLAEARLLDREAVIVLEHSWTLPPPPSLPGFRLTRQKHHGGTCISMYVRAMDGLVDPTPT